MKKTLHRRILFSAIIVLIMSSIVPASIDAQAIQRCGTDPLPESFENWIQPIVRDHDRITRRMVITLPMVFHIIHNGESIGNGPNISLAQIQSQIDVLNEDFRKTGDGANTDPAGADVMVEFCLGGINRVDRNDEGWSAAPFTKCYIDDNIKPATNWDATDYINVWVVSSATRCDGTGSLLGYSTWPEESGLSGVGTNNGDISQEDGVVIVASSAGRPPANSFGGVYNRGRTLTHELGHYFGLRHIWGDGDCSVDDFCGDTPNCDDEFYGCTPPGEQCTDAGDRMIENYLDYSDDLCMNIFTNDQNSRIQAVLLNSPRRMELATAGTCCDENFASASVTSNYNGAELTCFGASDGSVTVSTTGGEAPYQYQWDSNAGDATTATVSNLPAGTYVVIVTDAKGCVAESSTTINNPPSVSVSAFVTSNYNGQDISCFGATDGEATASGGGGTAPYSYEWSDGQSGSVASNLGAGTYSVEITDANGCQTTTTVTLANPPLLSIDATITSDYNGEDISCFGAMDGTASASANGGTPPYTYQWSNGQAGALASNLDATTYSVEVTDANGCAAETSLTLTQPDPLTIEAGDNQTVFFGYPPAACAIISWSNSGGGVPPYTISWSDGGAESHEVCPEITTAYTVTIVDANGCIETDEVTICAIDVRCGNKLNKVEICHYPPDNPTNPGTLCVSQNSVEDHLSHGDLLAACGTITICPPPSGFVLENDLILKRDEDLKVSPNPFNQSSQVSFTSPTSGNVNVHIYDLTGKMIYKVFSGYLEAGQYYQSIISEKDIPKGIFICSALYEDGSRETVRLIRLN